MTKFDIELVGKVGSMALINKEYNDINYNVIARLSKVETRLYLGDFGRCGDWQT